jgi:hypothetical protein
MADKKISDLLTDNPVTAAELTATMGLEIYDPDGATDTLKSGGTLISSVQAGLWRLYPDKIPFTFDGAGSVITNGSVREWLVPWDCTILGWTGIADQTGSITIDLRNETYANYSASIPDSGDTIVASAPIALSSAIKNTDTTLTGWTTTLAGGSVVRFVVTAISTCTRFHGQLHVRRTA